MIWHTEYISELHTHFKEPVYLAKSHFANDLLASNFRSEPFSFFQASILKFFGSSRTYDISRLTKTENSVSRFVFIMSFPRP